MGRSRQSAKAAGSRMERLVADFLAEQLDDRIDRKVLGGAKDRGDIGGVRTPDGRRIVVEVKDHGGKIQAGPWLKEAEVERHNDGADVGLVVAKRRGNTDPADQIVLMSLMDLVELLRRWEK